VTLRSIVQSFTKIPIKKMKRNCMNTVRIGSPLSFFFPSLLSSCFMPSFFFPSVRRGSPFFPSSSFSRSISSSSSDRQFSLCLSPFFFSFSFLFSSSRGAFTPCQWSQAMHSIDNGATYAGIKACVTSLGTNSPHPHIRQMLFLLLLCSACCPVCCIPALIFLELAQHSCASHVNLPFTHVRKVTSHSLTQSLVSRPQFCTNAIAQVHIHAARMCSACVVSWLYNSSLVGTGAPQNHWFGPAGDPRGAGIGTPEAIKLVWSCHREIINDVGPIPEGTAMTQT